MRRAVLPLLAALAGPAGAEAPTGIERVASRLFLAPGLPDLYADAEDRLHLTPIPWAWEVIQADPLLDGALLSIRQRPSPPAYLFSLEVTSGRFPDAARVPEAFRVEGYEAATDEHGAARLMLRPDVGTPNHLLTSAARDSIFGSGVFNFCLIQATYPLDPAIVLEATLYSPPPFAELAERLPLLAERMREVALCLDVAAAPPADPDAALAALLAANPRIEGCADAPSS